MIGFGGGGVFNIVRMLVLSNGIISLSEFDRMFFFNSGVFVCFFSFLVFRVVRFVIIFVSCFICFFRFFITIVEKFVCIFIFDVSLELVVFCLLYWMVVFFVGFLFFFLLRRCCFRCFFFFVCLVKNIFSCSIWN